MSHVSGTQGPELVVRAIATAGKTLRLYPPSSALPRQSVDVAIRALGDYFSAGDSTLALAVERDGLSWAGTTLGGALGANSLIDQLRDHAVAALVITPRCSLDELLTFLTALELSPAELRSDGGLEGALTKAGVDSIRVSDVQLTVAETSIEVEEEDLSDFLRTLATDPERLAIWFRAASAGDPRAFEEGLMELVRVSGPSGYAGLLKSLSTAFLAQTTDGRDAMLGLAMDQGPSRDLTGDMFGHLTSNELAGSVLEGSFGRNMLSLSSALTRLPLDQVTQQVRAEVQAMLPGSGHTGKEANFLDHMIEVRESAREEAPLIDADRSYRAVAEAATLPEDVIERARGAVAGSSKLLSAASVRTMLSLLNQQTDFELYCDTAQRLATLIPHLIDQGDLSLATLILGELSKRESGDHSDWPELPIRMREVLSVAGGPKTMAALARAATADPDLLHSAKEIVAHASEAGITALVAEAAALKEDGLQIAEGLLGRRIIDHLNRVAPQLPWFQLAAVVARIATVGDSQSAAVLDALVQRPDEQSRREVIAGLAEVPGLLAERILTGALRDPSPDVTNQAVRSLVRTGHPHSAVVLIARLNELSLDTTDFELGREIIVGLGRLPGSSVDTELTRLASRRSLFKRGHYGEVQDLVRQAQELRAREGVPQ